jgi:hypothetical protein
MKTIILGLILSICLGFGQVEMTKKTTVPHHPPKATKVRPAKPAKVKDSSKDLIFDDYPHKKQ